MARVASARLAAAALAVFLPASASALDLGLADPGLRAGLSVNPDQFHAGVDAEVAGRGRLRFRPSFELGIGNGVRLAALNGDVVWRLGGAGRRRFFAGGGPALTIVDVTDGVGEGRGVEKSLAGNVIAGVVWDRRRAPRRSGRRYLLEARAGVGDTPDFKLTGGVSF
jgi:hypothetical protein